MTRFACNICRTAALLAVAMLTAGVIAAPGEGEKPAASGAPLEAHLIDGSRVKVLLKDEKIEINTRYGKLTVPVTDIRRVEFATRIPEELQKRIDTAIANLGSEEHAKREAATTELLEIGPAGYPYLVEASKSKDPEVVRRAEEILGKLREKHSEDRLKVRKDDVLHTDELKITGRIVGTTLKVTTAAFGERQVRLADLTGLGDAPAAAATALNVMPDPGSPYKYNNEIGKTFAFTVTGAAGGSVWGTDVYTSDSTIATAAVHAGVLAPGQTSVVKLMMLVSPPGFVGTTRNGVTTSNYGPYTAAYQFVK